MTYIDADLITDETAVAEAFLAAIADRLNAALDLSEEEQWEAQEGSPETSIGEAAGIIIATACALVQDTERNDYAAFGELILGVPRVHAEPAEGTATWNFNAVGNYRIDDGSELVLTAVDGSPVGFAVVGDHDVVAADTADVPIVAIEPGAITSGLSGTATDYEPLPNVVSVVVSSPTAGGTDEQTRDEYITDVARRARRMKVVPIVTDDYAETAIDHPDVARAVAVRLLDLTSPEDPPSTVGHVSVFIVSATGTNLGSDVKAEVLDSMQGTDRPLAVTVHIGDPTRTNITIAATVRLETGADEPATVAAIQAAISAAYSPANYGLDENAPGRWRAPLSTAERTINEYDVAAVIDDIEGLKKIDGVTINGSASVTLTGWAPLPTLTAPATITVV
jgi:hypothetical protein